MAKAQYEKVNLKSRTLYRDMMVFRWSDGQMDIHIGKHAVRLGKSWEQVLPHDDGQLLELLHTIGRYPDNRVEHHIVCEIDPRIKRLGTYNRFCELRKISKTLLP